MDIRHLLAPTDFGWTLQLAMGVAFWILPRFARGRERGNEALAWCAFILPNAGVWLVGVGWMLGAPGWIPWLGRAVEAAAAITFAAHAWPRVKPFATERWLGAPEPC
jgi:hypothetical protein